MTHQETERWIARVVLFAHMEKLLAADLRELRDSCLPSYGALVERGRQLSPHLRSPYPALLILTVSDGPGCKHYRERIHWIDGWCSLAQAAEHFAEAKELLDQVTRWVTSRHMMTNWFLDMLLVNLLAWNTDSEAAQSLSWSVPGSMSSGQFRRRGPDGARLHGVGTLDRGTPVPSVKPYNPSIQTRQEHRRELNLELERYYERQEGLFTSAGFKKTVPKRARTIRSRPWLHFEWFIKYQMQGRSASEIAAAYTRQAIGEDTICSAMRDLAKTLDVSLRRRAQQSKKQLKKKMLKS